MENKFLIESINLFANLAFIKNSFIKKLPNGKYRVESHKGRNLGTYNTKEEAEKRLKQIEFFKYRFKSRFKHKKAEKEENDHVIDLSNLDSLSYSAIMRELRKTQDDEVINNFLTIYKQIFDHLVLDGEKEPAEKTLPVVLMILGKLYNLKLND